MAISGAQLANAPAQVRDASVVPNPLRVEEWPFAADKEDWLLWIGRMNADKGPHRAIRAARAADMKLVLAGPVQPGQEDFFAQQVQPAVDGTRVAYAGEADAAGKRELYTRSRAVLMPIRWAEPFGLVMIEAMACGTPVIAFPEGAAREIVLHGDNGFLVDDEQAMAAAVRRVDEIDPRRCRQTVQDRYDVPGVCAGYEAAYGRAINHRGATPAARSATPDLLGASTTRARHFTRRRGAGSERVAHHSEGR